MQMREKDRKGRKVAKHCVFPMICGSGGSKRRLAKVAGAEPSGKMRDEKLHAIVARSTFRSQNVQNTPALFGSWDVEKVHAIAARSTFRSQNVQNTPGSDHFLEVEMSKKCTPLWCEAHFEVKMYKAHHVRTTFGRSELVSLGRRKGLCTLSKVSTKCEGFVAFPKTMAGVGHFQKCMSRGRRSTKDMFIRDVRRSGRWFPERGCILEHQIFRFAKMILRDRCSTSYDLASLFRGRRSTLGRWNGKIAKRIGTRPSALHSTFHFWRKSRRIAWFLMLSSSKIEEVSQNCFVLDVVKFKKWRSLAELLRFWCCQLRKMRKPRRIASFLMLSTSKNEEASQNCFVFDVVNFEKWGSLAELLRFWCCQLLKNEDVTQNS